MAENTKEYADSAALNLEIGVKKLTDAASLARETGPEHIREESARNAMERIYDARAYLDQAERELKKATGDYAL